MSSSNLLIIRPADILAESASSGFGISYWSEFLGCAAKSFYKNKYPHITLLPEPLEKGEKLNMMIVGTFFHKLRELWRKGMLMPTGEGQFDSCVVEFDGAFEPSEWKEACRLFRFYTEKFSRSEWETLAVEEGFIFGCSICARQDGTLHGDNCIKHASFISCRVARECIDEWGVPCITGRWDEVVGVTEEQREPLINSRAITLFESGVYVVDAKCKTQRWSTVEHQLEDSMQSALYQEAWSRLNPNNPAKGMIFDTLYAYKTAPRSESFLVTNNDHKRKVLKEFLSKCWSAFLASGYQTNPARCFDYGKECSWRRMSVCNLLNPEVKNND